MIEERPPELLHVRRIEGPRAVEAGDLGCACIGQFVDRERHGSSSPWGACRVAGFDWFRDKNSIANGSSQAVGSM
jgi:hypothetical protein